jgi:hypothetical protein
MYMIASFSCSKTERIIWKWHENERELESRVGDRVSALYQCRLLARAQLIILDLGMVWCMSLAHSKGICQRVKRTSSNISDKHRAHAKQV